MSGGLPACLAYANAEVAKICTDDDISTKHEHRRRKSQLAKSFADLPPEQRQLFIEQADRLRTVKKQSLIDAAEEEARRAELRDDFASKGVGVSSKDWPVAPAIAKRIVARKCGLPEDAEFPGGAACWDAFRKDCLGTLYVSDIGDLQYSSFGF